MNGAPQTTPPISRDAPPAMTSLAGPRTRASVAGPMTPASTSIPLAAEHFGAAMLFLIAGAIGLVWIAPELAAGAYPSPHVAGITHLFTLGWLTTTIFGALYQLLPVALGAPVRWRALGHASFWTFAPGVALFAAGVTASAAGVRHVGIALVGTGVLLAVGNVAATLPRARTRDVTWAAIAFAIFFLTSTLTFGLVLLRNLDTGAIAAARVRVLGAHLHVAIVGWALIMIVGVAHRLVPMFLLAHHADTRWTRRALALLGAGVPVLAVGLLTQQRAVSWAGVVLLEGGIACFLRQAYAFYRVRVRRTLDVGLHFAACALLFLVASALLGPAVLARGALHGRLATAYVLVGLLGGIVLFVVGFFYKIVPLLAWTAHYARRMGTARTAVPTVAQTYSVRVAYTQLALMGPAVALLGGGIGVGSAHVVRCGAVLFLAGVLLFGSQFARVAVGRR